MLASAIIPIGFGIFRLQGQMAIDTVRSALALGFGLLIRPLYDNDEAVGEAIRIRGENHRCLGRGPE